MIVVVGVSHKTASIDLREQLALSPEAASDLCARLVASKAASEAFVVSTCNRVEVVAASDDGDLPRCAEACLDQLCALHPEIRSHAYTKLGLEGMRHLVRVASSLDSLVVGEPQILGQLKQGFEIARERGTIGAGLHRAFSAAVRGAKRVRSETSIGAGQVSVPSIAVQLAAQIFGDLAGHTVALVGVGEMGQSVARLLADQGSRLLVLGRSLERVRAVTDSLGGEPRLMADLPVILAEADVIVCSTSAPGAVISADALAKQRRARRGRNLFLIDLAVPRDVEPKVGELDGVFLYNIDDLSTVAQESAETRRREAERAALLVDSVVETWQRWSQGEQATPTIKALRARMRDALQWEMERSLKGRLRDLDVEQRNALSKMLDAGVNRILHAPTMQLRREAERDDSAEVYDLLALVSDLFGLNSESLPPASLDCLESLPDGEANPGSESAGSAAPDRAESSTDNRGDALSGAKPVPGDPSQEESPTPCAGARFSGA